MKTISKTAIYLASTLILAACGNKDKQTIKADATHNHEHTAREKGQFTPASKPVLKNDKLNAVYQHYMHLTVALSKGDITEAKIAANAIEAGSQRIEGASVLIASAEKIMAAPDIEKQRSSYSGMSKEMMVLIKKHGVSGGELYVAFCPMAFNDQGASWISETREIRNPYFGNKMLACGEVKEVIK